MNFADLLQSRVLFVTGKGGTGKTTLAVALSRLAASQGKRVILAEIDNQRSVMTEYFGRNAGFEPLTVEPNLDITNITWMDALVSWLGDTVKIPRVTKLILNNRMVSVFLMVTPGSREVVTFGRLLGLRRQYDLMVVDLPASGHAISFFRVPFSALHIFLSGPIQKICEEAIEMIRHASTRVILAALPEEMVVNETMETWSKLCRLAPELEPYAAFLNQAMSPSLSVDEKLLLGRLAEGRDLRPPAEIPGDEASPIVLAAELLRAGCWEAERESGTAEALQIFGRQFRQGVVPVPIFADAERPGEVARKMESHFRRQLLAEGAPSGAVALGKEVP